MAAISFAPIKDFQKLPLSISPVDAAGNPVPGMYSWSVDNPAVATLDVAADTLSAFLVSVAPGAVVVSVTDGHLIDTASGSVEASAVALNLAAGAPVDK